MKFSPKNSKPSPKTPEIEANGTQEQMQGRRRCGPTSGMQPRLHLYEHIYPKQDCSKYCLFCCCRYVNELNEKHGLRGLVEFYEAEEGQPACYILHPSGHTLEIYLQVGFRGLGLVLKAGGV